MAHLRVYIVTFNCGRALVDPSALSHGLFHALTTNGASPDIIVLCLEEIAPIAYAFLGGSFLAPYFSRIVETVKIASRGKQSYRHILSRNVGMTGLVLLATPQIAENIQRLETAGVGVGFMEMGNKGAVGVRFSLQTEDQDQTSDITFVAAHLAPMEDAVQRRNEDWENIVRGMAFTRTTLGSDTSIARRISTVDNNENEPLLSKAPIVSGMFTPKTTVFFAGDLNYRSRDIGPKPGDVSTFPQPTNDISDLLHYSHLLSTDQLAREHREGRTLHHLSEAPIDFPPTYKYAEKQVELSAGQKVNTGSEEPKSYLWASHRYPSWTDRVFFSSFLVKGRPPAMEIHNYTALPIQPTSDHRPVALYLTVNLMAAFQACRASGIEAKSPFPMNPDWQSRRTWARRREIFVGLGAYATTTWEGRGILIAIFVGSLGGWLVLGSLVGSWS